jgi:TPR repeat protein
VNVFGKLVALALVLPAAGFAQNADTTVGSALGDSLADGGSLVQNADAEAATPVRVPPEGTPPDGEPTQGADATGAEPFIAGDGNGAKPDDAVAPDAETEVAVTTTVAPAPAAPQALSQAAAQCLEIAGPADAGVPAAAVDVATQKETLARAAPFCTEAAADENADPRVLFHAATIARAGGDAQAMFDLLTRAAASGLGAAETRLGDAFLFGVAPGGQNLEKAVSHYRAATDLGDAAGTTTLALLYQVEQGVPRDTGRMLELMTRAADQGYHFAQFRLAQIYHKGEGVPGRADAALGVPDMAKALAYYAEAADAGNLDAALALSALYSDPNSGLSDDPEEQVRLTRIVSRTGYAPAIARMGVFYETGRGVDYNPAIAAGLYAKAMESGDIAFEQMRTGAPLNWDNATAIEFQKILIARGLYNGPLDAIVGPGTASGARALAAQ